MHPNYKQWLTEIKQRILLAQIKAAWYFTYQLSGAIPANLKDSLLMVEEIEAELNGKE